LIPTITDPAEARQCPELAVLSTQAHGQGPEGLSVAQAARSSLSGVDIEQAMIYWDMILLALPEAARRALEEQMQPGEYKYRSEWVLKHIEKWKNEGREEGTLEARRELARKLIAEGFPVEKVVQMVELEEAEVRRLAD
jgi:predicted transposase/invertase (TIGR01784 family)